ncbi:MAG: hypothetical protein ACK4UO_02530 [Pseudolabrys sp.]
MPTKLDDARVLLARANRMLAHEGVLDAFGHVTMRHPADPGRYLISRSRGPELVQPEDIHDVHARLADRQARSRNASTASASSTARSTRRGPR